MSIEDTIKRSIQAEMSQVMKQYKIKQVLTVQEVWEEYGQGYSNANAFVSKLKSWGVPHKGSNKNKLFVRRRIEQVLIGLDDVY